MSILSANGGVPKGNDTILQRPLVLQNQSTRVRRLDLQNFGVLIQSSRTHGLYAQFPCSSRWPSLLALLQTHGLQQKS